MAITSYSLRVDSLRVSLLGELLLSLQLLVEGSRKVICYPGLTWRHTADFTACPLPTIE